MKLRPVDNPPLRWGRGDYEWEQPPPPADLKIFEENARSILSENKSPDIPFRWSLNPYRGCFHGCAYCYARPTHGYWDFGAGTDFERKIVVKVNAPARLRATLRRRTWARELIVFSGNTDCYQPLEQTYELTRRCLEICHEVRNPVGIITKGSIIRRDLDLLRRMSGAAGVFVHLSIPFADEAMARRLEPGAPSPAARFTTMRRLAEAGIAVGVSVSPIIPGLSEDQIPEVLTRAREAGATQAFRVLIRLPAEVKPVFSSRLEEAYPDRARRVLNAVRDMRDGKLYRSDFGLRMSGAGPRWEAIAWLFDQTCRRLGLEVPGGGRNLRPAGPRPTCPVSSGPAAEPESTSSTPEIDFRRGAG